MTKRAKEFGFPTAFDMMEDYKATESPMLDFYRNKTVFLTGATGFIGKLMIEKLIRCNAKHIYVIARSKRDKTAAERINDIFEEPIFEQIKKAKIDYFSKITVMEGDLFKREMGITKNERQEIIDNVELVFHVAADVNFDSGLKDSIETNVRGTRDMMLLAAEIKNLTAFVYLSTAFCNCNRDKIEEKFYKTDLDPDFMIRVTEKLVDDQEIENFNILATQFIRPFPNTYIYTKSLAEQIVRKYGQNIPVAVVRPSIISTTYEDPIHGWADNIYGLNGVVTGAGMGVLRILHIDKEKSAECVPADAVVNSTLAVAWATYNENKNFMKENYDPELENQNYYNYENEKIQVYNCTVAPENKITWEAARRYITIYFTTYPPKKLTWLIRYNTTSYYYVFQILKILYHFIPALLMDQYLKINGKKPKLLKLYRKVNKFSEVITFFTKNEWQFCTKNISKLYNSMSGFDRDYFRFDMKNMDWDDFFGVYVKGIRKHIVKEPMSNLPEARKVYRKFFFIHYAMLAVLYSIAGYSAYQILSFYGLTNKIYSSFNEIKYYLNLVVFGIYEGIIRPVIEIYGF